MGALAAAGVATTTTITITSSLNNNTLMLGPCKITRTCVNLNCKKPSTSLFSSSSSFSTSGLCKASQVADLFPVTSPEIVVREARLVDYWGVAETHCSCFFPKYSFPWNFMLRFNRVIGMLFGFPVPSGCQRTCLAAAISSSDFGAENFRIESLGGRFSLSKGYVIGILTLDTVADFLPRKGPLQQRRTGIAYISNVAVLGRYRRKGIAKRLIAGAESKAKIWGCHAIALHCDPNNAGATNLYKGQGFKCIKVPEGANWPQPKASPDVQFNFMMKLL